MKLCPIILFCAEVILISAWAVTKIRPSYPFEVDLMSRFSDPGSVENRDVVQDRSLHKFCCQMNARNMFGGSVGFLRFIALPSGSGYRITLSDDVGGQFPVWCS